MVVHACGRNARNVGNEPCKRSQKWKQISYCSPSVFSFLPCSPILSVLPSSPFPQFCCPLCSLCSPVLSVLSVLPSSLFSQFCCPLCSLSSPVLSVLSVLPSSQSSQFCRPLNFPVLSVLSVLLFSLHCKNIWVALTIFWLSQLHTCYVRDTVINFKDASNLIQSVVEKLLYFVRLGSSCRRPINQHFW